MDRALYFAALFVVLLAAMPPTGILSGNEENYFGLAARSAGALGGGPYSALFDGSHHRFLNEFLLGNLIRAVGFEAAQIAARLVAALGYTIALGLWFRSLGLRLVDAVIVLLVFLAFGQTLMGGEWLFGGYEGKVAAYIFVLLGLYALLIRRARVWGALAFAAATYFHFLVGGFWFAAALLFLILDRAGWRPIALAVALYLAAILPLLVVIGWDRIHDLAPTDYAGPTPDQIYAFIRSPHHVAPFLTGSGFETQWLPGLVVAALMALAAFRFPGHRAVAIWLAVLLLYLLVAAAASWFDRDTGWLGKFYLFRPASLILLLWLGLAATLLSALPSRPAWLIRVTFFVAAAPGFILGVTGIEFGPKPTPRIYAAIIEETPPSKIVLIDPALEHRYFDFERRTGRPSLVAWKFDNTNDRDIVEWRRRMEFRAALFGQGCAFPLPYAVAYLVTAPEQADAVARSCGLVAYRGEEAALIYVHPRE